MDYYLADSYCPGVKDAFYILRAEEFELQDHIKHDWNHLTLRECSYEEAHSRIYSATAFAADFSKQ